MTRAQHLRVAARHLLEATRSVNLAIRRLRDAGLHSSAADLRPYAMAGEAWRQGALEAARVMEDFEDALEDLEEEEG
jgi:hypothetical protein